MSAPVSTAVHLASRNTQALHLRGTDRYGHISDLSTYGEGEVVFDLPLIPTGVPRLRNLASTYQRVRWKKLTIRFEPLVPTMAVGGYVCGFIPDADDSLLETKNPLDRLMAHPGSKLAKIWQSSTVTHRCAPDLLYTSPPGKGEARLYSPGRVALVIDSKVGVAKDVAAPLSIYLDWEVELSEPSLEGVTSKGSTPECKANFYLRSSNVGLWWKDGAGGDDPRLQIPGIAFNVTYRIGSKRFAWMGTEGAADEVIGSFDKVMLTNDPTHGVTLWVVNYEGVPLTAKSAKNIFFLEKGDILVPEPKNLTAGLEHLQLTRSQERSGPKPELSCPLSKSLDRWEVV